MLKFSCYEYLFRFLNFTMVYNLFIFISVFLLPEIPEISGSGFRLNGGLLVKL